MRWDTRAPKEAKPWKRWFVWYPVRIEGDKSCNHVWLEWINRQRYYQFGLSMFPMYRYRLPQKQEKSK